MSASSPTCGGRGAGDQQRDQAESVGHDPAGPLGEPVPDQDADGGAQEHRDDVHGRTDSGDHRISFIFERLRRDSVSPRLLCDRPAGRRVSCHVRHRASATPVPRTPSELIDLWAAVSGLADPAGSGRGPRGRRQALATIALDPDERLLVAEHDDRLVGAMKLSRGPLWPLALDQAVHSSFLLVLPQYRRHGIGHALMEAALAWAEEKDLTQITVVTDGNRETNRFFARLGLGALGNVRHAHTATLRKKLAASRPAVATGTSSRCWPSAGRCAAAMGAP